MRKLDFRKKTGKNSGICDRGIYKILKVSWKQKKSNKWILQKTVAE